MVRFGTDQIPAGHAPCRYRVPFDTPRVRPTLWGSHSFLFFLLLFPLIFPPFDTSITFTDDTVTCIGCHRPCQRHHRFPAGEEAHPREEGPHSSRQAQPQPLGSRLGFLFAVYCDLCCRFSILCTCRFMPPTTSNICAPRLEPSSVRCVRMVVRDSMTACISVAGCAVLVCSDYREYSPPGLVVRASF